MLRDIAVLLIEARRHLGVSQGALGEMLGSSERTGQRWERGGSTPMPKQLHELARQVHPKDPSLAAEIATAGGSSLEILGIVRPSPPPAPAISVPPIPPPPAPDPAHIVDTVVCAAAEAMQMMPDAIRPALRAAFRRARLAGLSVEAVDKALQPAKSDGTPSTPNKKRS